MILLFDVGNTSIYTGVGKNGEILSTFRLNTDLNKTPDEYYLTIKEFVKPEEVTGIIIGSVVPQVTLSLIKIAEKYFKINPVIIQPGVKTGVMIKTDNPREVGADLIADAAGVETNDSTLIIDLGTANKFIYVKNKTITGVIIAPGIHLSIKALAGNTALLHEVEVKAPSKYLGNNTVNCIQSGVIYGTVTMIEGMVGRIKEEVKEDFKIILTGGLSRLIQEYLRLELIRDSRLVLKGLLNIYQKNQ
ncbi:type III pantothenate kinase [Acholeplasma hippikon]|uniref:Type III pantothenate kinase n=1 Tax=Acholeplasma hippikon TaxID=264636 RepID=A0A449BJ99_9MOLU|nr:type III pantothenate kinase [Acholeplasma hippikon]VEU82539.1 putative transcriptional regulator [Acholeplasma hippikon]